jgi:hypothetical protein
LNSSTNKTVCALDDQIGALLAHGAQLRLEAAPATQPVENELDLALHVGLALERALVDDLLQQLLEQRRTGRAQQRVDLA